MRISSEGTSRGLRYTIFIHDGKFSLKLEGGQNEQIYKFRDGAFTDENQIVNYIKSDAFSNVVKLFMDMDKIKKDIHQQALDSLADNFEELI